MIRFTADLKDTEVGEDGGHREIGDAGATTSTVTLTDERLDGCVLSRIVGPDCDIVAFAVRAPRSGEFGLEIYTTICDDDRQRHNPVVDPDETNGSYQLYGQFLIVCDEVPWSGVVRAFPRMSPG